MAVDVYAADEQADRAVDLDRWTTLARSVLADRGVRGDVEVSLLFVDEPAIAALNQQFLGRGGPTDVLAFPIEDEPVPGGRSPDSGGSGPGVEPEDDPLVLLGDVVVCPAVAARNAVEHEATEDDELALLVVHGLLHLLGMDHETDAEAERMERLERELLARHHHGEHHQHHHHHEEHHHGEHHHHKGRGAGPPPG
jgi:probable rRNA maturation factor